MDYLDPKQRRHHTIRLLTGYVLIAIAIIIAAVILLYQAYGFGLGKNGTVIQNGLVFFSSQPHPATIYLNNKLAKIKTNSRIVLPAGIYQARLTRTGYRSWQRTIEVDGGDVVHFDYPFLFPTMLTTTSLRDYQTPPALASQSPDHRWLLIQPTTASLAFDLYDLKNPTVAPAQIRLPTSVASAGTTQSWQILSWADDNDHVLLEHTFDGKTEYINLDRSEPAQSINLTAALNIPTGVTLSLDNLKYDQYYEYDMTAKTLESISLKTTVPQFISSDVLAFQAYSDNTYLYVTADNAPTGKVNLNLLTTGSLPVTIRTFPTNTTYLLNLTNYSGTLYVAAGAVSEGKVYIYKDPVAQIQNKALPVAVPAQVLRVADPSWLQFSSNAQFIAAEGGQQFGVYDIENMHGYTYSVAQPLDAPQLHANWMDGDRLDFISGGKLEVFDYDHTNVQTLTAADPAYTPFFSSDYHNLYMLAPSANKLTMSLEDTPLLTKADQ
jgi:hypothetical protein